MNLELINRIIKTSVILSAFLFPFLSVYVSTAFAVAYFLGCLWACLNLFSIKFLIVQIITPNPRSKLFIVLFILLKFPLIYFLGYLLVVWSYTPIYGLLIGFSSLLAVTVLKAVSRSMLQSKKIQVKAL
ncbi:MAG: hypothetical protein J7K40_01810 [candidate division Zixibacteria bacterium]|nr:hypothetical protein [candidate division Zixibacteria bacterium]